MSISTVSGSGFVSQVSQVSGVQAGARTSSIPPAQDSSNVSPFGQLMSGLSQLAQQDPSQFKAVTSQIAEQLKQEASTATGPQAQALGKLGAAFDQASQSGSMQSLQPQGAGGGHHHHHHHGGGSGGATASGQGAVASAISSALDLVSQALQGSSSTPSASSSASSAG